MTPRQFVHLHTHSEYSEFDGLSTVKRIAAAAAADGNPAVAITDHGTIASTWALRSECEHFGIKPIPGIEAYMIVRGTRESPEKIHVAADAVDTDAGDGDEGATGRATKTKTYEHLTILAHTAEGFRNLILLANISQETKWGGHPLMDYELLAEHGEGLIVLTGCLGGPVAGPLSRITGENDEHDEAEMSRAQENVDKLISAVGRENVYVEVADHGIPAQESALPRLYDFAEKNGLRIVAANDSHYVKKQEQPAHEGWIALGLSKQRKGKAITVSSEDRYRFSGHGHHLRTAEEMHAVRPDDERWQEACDETVRIAERIEDDLYPPTRLRVPRFPIPAAFTKRIERGLKEGEDGATLAYFKRRIQVGAKYRFGTSSPIIRERLSHESEVVRNLGMMDYFLIVADIIEWARSDWTIQDWIDRHDGVREIAEDDPDRERKEPILVGPGRGSAAGSLISYCLLIVNADPLENGLLFERFLDPERTEMPDIDVDFEKLRRPEVIEYISARYGRENVCYLGMHGTNKTKSALDSAGRYLEISTNVVTEIKKLLHDDTPTISAMMRQSSEPESPGEDASESEKKAYEAAQEAYEKGVDIRHHLAENPHLRTFFLYASVYESVVTNPGKHACGFVISDEPLLPLIPMWINKDGERVSEWDGGDVADFGLLKMDILGLRTLDVARAAEDNARANYGDIPFDFMEPNLGGAEADRAWGMLGEGRSVGVFQLESGGMRDLLTTAHPSNLDDLSALIAAFRPGPMSAGMHTDWAERTGGKKKVSYDNLTTDPAEQEVIASVLGETSGVILFQEQMMRLGKVVGNFTAAQANQLRRAISKKKQSMLDELKPVFISGAQTEGVGENGEVVPVISRETAERLWVAFEGSGAYAFNKCISGSTVIRTVNQEWSVEEIYNKLHGESNYGSEVCACGKPKRSARRICTTCESWVSKFRRDVPSDKKNPGGFRVLAYDFADGRIRPKRVKDVHYNGVREIVEITTESGRKIGVTDNHRLMGADRQWVEAGDLSVGDELVMHGGFEAQRFADYRTTRGGAYDRRSGVSPRGFQSDSLIDGGHSRFVDWTEKTVADRECVRPGEHQGRFERAHLDGDRTNNDPSNLEWMCVRHHKEHDYRHNGRNRQWGVGHAAVVEKIVSITPLPAEPVYDLEMDDEGHNFIADGFVSHNSHTTAYGLVAYQTAYLKANWPAEFGAATLRFTETSKDKAPRRIAAMNSLRDEKIEIMAPDVNMSEAATVARDGKVWIGLGEVKGVGDIAHTIIAEREENGPYTSMADLAARARRSTTDDSGRKRTKGVNYSQLCSLAQAGAFDAWGPRLGHMVSARAVMKNPSVPIPDFEWSIVERAARQRDVLRTTIDGHPTTVLHDQIQRIDGDGQTDATPRGLQELHALPDAAHRNVDTYGIVSSISRRFTRKGSKMMTMDLESERAIVKTVGFSRTVESLESSGTMPAEGDLVRIKGKVEIREYEKETTDEETGETATEKVVERSIILDSVEPLLVEDEPREQEKHVGFVDLLLGSAGDDESENQDDDGDPGDDSGPGDDPDDGPDSDPDDPEPSDDGVVPEWADDWDAEPEPAPEPAADPAPAESPEDSPDVASKPSEVLAAAEAAYEDDPDDDDDDDDAEDDEPVDKRTMLNKNLETAEETDAWRALLVEIEKSFPENGPAGFGKLARFPEAGDPEAKDWETTPVALSSGDLPLRFGTRTLAVVDLSDRRTPFSAGGMGRMNRGQVIVVVDPMEAVSQIESVTAAIRSGAWTPGDLDQRGPIPIGE